MEHNKSRASQQNSVDFFFHKPTASIGSVDSLQDHSSIIAVYPDHTKESIQNKKHFPALMAQGVALWFATQGIINMGVNVGLFPTKGLTLPLLSFGGSGILLNMVAVAIVLKIDHENRRNMRGQYY